MLKALAWATLRLCSALATCIVFLFTNSPRAQVACLQANIRALPGLLPQAWALLKAFARQVALLCYNPPQEAPRGPKRAYKGPVRYEEEGKEGVEGRTPADDLHQKTPTRKRDEYDRECEFEDNFLRKFCT